MVTNKIPHLGFSACVHLFVYNVHVSVCVYCCVYVICAQVCSGIRPCAFVASSLKNEPLLVLVQKMSTILHPEGSSNPDFHYTH